MNAFIRHLLLGMALTCFSSTLQAQQQTGTLQLTGSPELQQNIIKGEGLVTGWLNLIDQGRYDASWESASRKFQLTIPQDEWVKVVASWRKPVGEVVSRQIADIRVAEDPPNMPPGEYLVYIFRTAFRNKPEVTELVIIFQTDAGDWKVLSYHMK